MFWYSYTYGSTRLKAVLPYNPEALGFAFRGRADCKTCLVFEKGLLQLRIKKVEQVLSLHELNPDRSRKSRPLIGFEKPESQQALEKILKEWL